MWKVGTTGYGNGDHKVEFAIESTGPVTIYWGDGQKTENATTGTHSYTYTSSGDKKIVIAGPLTRFYNPREMEFFYGPNYITQDPFQKLTAVTDWGNMRWTSMQAMFADANKLTMLPVRRPDLNLVTDMSYMFYNTTIFNQPLNSWNVSNVTDMSNMFYGATSFNQPLNNWNVSNVTDMNGMFSDATSFNQPIGNWNVSNVTDM